MSFGERTARLFESDILAAYDFASYSQPGYRPEERLMMAVLSDALLCLQKYHLASDKQGRKNFTDAEQWVLDNGNQWPFSFANICDTLGISPGYLRGQLVRWQTKHMHQRPRSSLKLRSRI